jgi:tetratricopeptide (TPR) repeat protein
VNILAQAAHLLSVKRPQQALDLLQQHGAELAGHPAYFHLLGDCYLDLKQYQRAAAQYQEARAIAPNDIWIRLSQVNLKIITGDLVGAELLWEDCRHLAPELPELYGVKGEILLRKSAFDESIEQLDRALSLDPHYAAAHELKSLALTLKTEYDAADRSSGAALRIDPENAGALSAKAWNELLRGQPQKAEAIFRAALRIDPLDTTSLEGFKQALKSRSHFWRPLLELELLALKNPGVQRLFTLPAYLLAIGSGLMASFSAAEGSGRLVPLLTGLSVYLLVVNFLPKIVPVLAMLPLLFHESVTQLLTKREIIVGAVSLTILFVGLLVFLAAIPFAELTLLNGLLLLLAGTYTAELRNKQLTGGAFFALLFLNLALLALSILYLDTAFRSGGLTILLLVSFLVYPYLVKWFSLGRSGGE